MGARVFGAVEPDPAASGPAANQDRGEAADNPHFSGADAGPAKAFSDGAAPRRNRRRRLLAVAAAVLGGLEIAVPETHGALSMTVRALVVIVRAVASLV